MDRNTAIVTIFTICGIVTIAIMAIIHNIDGSVLSTVFVILGGLGGFTLDRLITRRKK